MPRLFGRARYWDAYVPRGFYGALAELGVIMYATDGATCRGEWLYNRGGVLEYTGPSTDDPVIGINAYEEYGRVYLSSAVADVGADSQFYYNSYLDGIRRSVYWAFPADPANVRAMTANDIVVLCSYGVVTKAYASDPYYRGVETNHGIYNDATGNGAIGAAPTGINGAGTNRFTSAFTRGVSMYNGSTQERWYTTHSGVTAGNYTPAVSMVSELVALYNSVMGTAYTDATLPLNTEMHCAAFLIRNGQTGQSRRLVVVSPPGFGTAYAATNVAMSTSGSVAAIQYPRLIVNAMSGVSASSCAAPSTRTGCTFALLATANPTDAQLVAIAQQMFDGVPL